MSATLSSNVTATPYFAPGDGPTLDTYSQNVATVMDKAGVARFANTGDRDAAYTDLIADGEVGMICWVVSTKRYYCYDGDAWNTFPVRGIDYQIGIADDVTDVNGLVAVNHTVPMGVSTNYVVTFDFENFLLPDVVIATKAHIQERQPGFFVIRFVRVDDMTALAANPVRIHWRVEKI